MSQPQGQAPGGAPPQYPAQAYSQGASPIDHSAYAQPPAKRMRMSPEAQSPHPQTNGLYRASPVVTPGGYGNPYAQGTPQFQQYQQQLHSPASFNTPEPYGGHPGHRPWPLQQTQYLPQQRAPTAASPPSSSAMMPPPPKPNREERDEKVGVDDINDAMWSSGVNLKDEENYMHNMYQTRYTANDSFVSQQGSFGSSTQPGGSFSLLTQGTSFGSAGAGTLGPVVSETALEDELKHKRSATARDKAEREQHQLRNPFLLGNVLRLRIDKTLREQGVRVAADGVYVARPEARVMTNGSNSEGVVAARIPAQVDVNAPFAELLSLLSLAAGERVRGLLDESYGLAKARRYGDGGRVPVEFADIATGQGKSRQESVKQESITGTPWDAVPEAVIDKPQTTIAFQSAVNDTLRAVAKQDQDAELRRIAKREARRKAAEANPDDTMDDSLIDLKASMAAEASPAAGKVTKKELARQQKEKASFTEAQAATSTNQTAALMAMGRKGQKYNWMNPGAASMTTNRFAKPVASSGSSGSGTPSKKDGARTPVRGKDTDAKAEMVWGEWREDGKGGKGIQIRDWLLVLERDGRQKTAWEKALLKIGDPAVVPSPTAPVQAPSNAVPILTTPASGTPLNTAPSAPPTPATLVASPAAPPAAPARV